MVVNQKVTGKTRSMPGGLAVGWIASAVVTLLGAMIVAYLLDSGKMQMSGIGYGTMIILLAGAIFGAVLAFRCIRRQRLVVCLLSGAVYFLSLLALTALFFGGQYEGIGVTALVILGASLAVGLMGLKPKRGVRHR